MSSKVHVIDGREIYLAGPRAATRGREWGIALPIGLMVVFAVVAGILGILSAETVGEQAVQAAQLGVPFFGF